MGYQYESNQCAMLPRGRQELLGTTEKLATVSIQPHRKRPNSDQDVTGQGQTLPEK